MALMPSWENAVASEETVTDAANATLVSGGGTKAVTVKTARKFVPVKVTGIVAPCTPLDGAIAVRVGTAAFTVKAAVPVVPPAVVTVTLRAPKVAVAATVRVAVS